MSGAPHRVRRQLWRIRAASAGDAFVLRREVRAAWEGALLPALEAAFDEVAGDGTVVRIPRLELRVRIARPEDVVAELPRLIREAAATELALVRRGGAPSVSADGDEGVSPAEDRRATLLHYLRTGTLPWAAAGGPADEVTAELRRAVHAEGPRLVDHASSAPEPRAFAFRLLQLLDEGDVEAWVAALPARVPPLWRRVLLRLLSDSSAAVETVDSGGSGSAGGASAVHAWAPPPRHARLAAAAALLADALDRSVDDTPEAIVAFVVRGGDGGAGDAIRSLLASFPDVVVRRREGKRGRGMGGQRRPVVAVDAGSGDVGDVVDAKDVARQRAAAPSAAKVDADASVVRIAGSGASRADTAAGEDFALSVANAGLILMHVFIGPLLEHRGMRDGDLIPPHALPRAAALLHYLATGRDEVLEWELGLVKVLLGLTPDEPLLVADGLLTADDCEECEHLLRSAVAHWSVLRDSSPALVRESFLRRGGLLRRDVNGWTLRVEPAPFDVLLAHLPWGIGVARLPWMPHPIHTEWTTTP